MRARSNLNYYMCMWFRMLLRRTRMRGVAPGRIGQPLNRPRLTVTAVSRRMGKRVQWST
jgi:hypothetical protein